MAYKQRKYKEILLMKKSGIYKISFEDKSFYIGSTGNLKAREKLHLSALKRDKHHNKILQYMFDRYGKFEFEILEYVPAKQLLIKEQEYIDKLNPEINLSPFA